MDRKWLYAVGGLLLIALVGGGIFFFGGGEPEEEPGLSEAERVRQNTLKLADD